MILTYMIFTAGNFNIYIKGNDLANWRAILLGISKSYASVYHFCFKPCELSFSFHVTIRAYKLLIVIAVNENSEYFQS